MTGPALLRFVVGDVVGAVMQLDALHEGGRGECYGVALADIQPKRGVALVGTREGLAKFAKCLAEIDLTCDDASASARRACKQAAERIRVFLKEGSRS